MNTSYNNNLKNTLFGHRSPFHSGIKFHGGDKQSHKHRFKMKQFKYIMVYALYRYFDFKTVIKKIRQSILYIHVMREKKFDIQKIVW